MSRSGGRAAPDLAQLLDQVGRDRPLPADGAVTVLSGPGGTAVAAVLGFTAHHVIAADVDQDWLMSTLGRAEMSRPMKPNFLTALGVQLEAEAGGQDVLMVGEGTDQVLGSDLIRDAENPAAVDHHRVERALRYRDNVRIAVAPGGLLTVGQGLAGRWEISLEVDEAGRGSGIGRALARHGRTLVPGGALLWAQVHPANVASMRVFLAAGYRPVGAEVLFTRAHLASSP